MRKRDPFFDNAKFILITLVVLEHLVESVIDVNLYFRIYYLTNLTFHMPVFIIITGYFAKNYTKPRFLTGTINKVLVPYLVFQAVFTLGESLFKGSPITFAELVTPNWLLWFLVSLFTWNILLPYYLKLVRYPVVTAFAVGLLAGYTPIGYLLGLSRTVVFFPFYILGFSFI